MYRFDDFLADPETRRLTRNPLDPIDPRAEMVDETLYWLDRAVEDGAYELTYLAFWPHWDLLRDDPRYPDLLERIYGEMAQELGGAGASTPISDR